MSRMFKTLTLILGTLVLMAASGIVTLAVAIMFLMELGTRLPGNYEYYGNWASALVVWGLAAIAFLAPGVIVSYLHKRGYKRVWVIVVTLALIVVIGTVTYAVLLHVFLPPQPPPSPPVPHPQHLTTPLWPLGSRLHHNANYPKYPAFVWGF